MWAWRNLTQTGSCSFMTTFLRVLRPAPSIKSYSYLPTNGRVGWRGRKTEPENFTAPVHVVGDLAEIVGCGLVCQHVGIGCHEVTRAIEDEQLSARAPPGWRHNARLELFQAHLHQLAHAFGSITGGREAHGRVLAQHRTQRSHRKGRLLRVRV